MISSASPEARRRGRCGCSARLAATTWDPRGIPARTTLSTSWQAGERISWRSSSISTNDVGAVAHRRGEQRCGTTERRDAVPADVGRQAFHARRHQRVRGRQQGEEGRGIVVESVERHPRDGSLLGVRPLGHQRGLAVSGGRRDAHDATPARPRGLEDVGATDGASGWGLRDQIASRRAGGDPARPPT